MYFFSNSPEVVSTAMGDMDAALAQSQGEGVRACGMERTGQVALDEGGLSTISFDPDGALMQSRNAPCL
jgi:hypothetical protein